MKPSRVLLSSRLSTVHHLTGGSRYSSLQTTKNSPLSLHQQRDPNSNKLPSTKKGASHETS